MMLIILTGLIALASAAQLPSRSYLPQGQGGSLQSFQSSQSSSSFSTGGTNDNGNRRPQQDAEKNAVILKQDQEVSESGFRYGYETSNGIRAEESGNTAQTQGGFSYKGDDGNTYTITFTAGEGGFRPEGAHLPVPPPTPDEILVALRKNAEDEAKGIFDDGQYRAGNEGSSNQQSSFGSQSSFSSGSQSSFSSGSFNSNSGYHY